MPRVFPTQANRQHGLRLACGGVIVFVLSDSTASIPSRLFEKTTAAALAMAKTGLDDLAVRDMSKDQQEGVRAVLRDLLAPFRKEDADEAMKLIQASGFEDLHMAFYKAGDIGKDGVWDVWQLERPNMVWHFRGATHVHVWANIRG